MKFFAPRNDWSMANPESWWPLIGTSPTSSGVRVSQETALTYSAVFACTRIISETLASLPLMLLEQVDHRTTKKATDHPLYPLLHDSPNPEMDIVTFLDMQVALQLNWGNAYAEVERDGLGKVVALWPIHPSRVPLCNIYRNSRNVWEIHAGQPGELVYEVNNDDGTTTPIPASDMLHIPGVLSRNGITGQSVITYGAEALGVAIATDQHAGAYFRNGAVSNMALTSPKVVGKETAERLRAQWQTTFAGVRNHYKTLLLEDGITPHPFSINPEASQLVDSRALNHRIVASHIYRVPSHMIGDKEASTFSNVEQEEMSFKTKTMLIWIVRWEKAIHRQLLSAEEKRRFRPRFNVMGLLRGDSAARAQFFQVMFSIGAFSPNMILELEDMNPIEGGDQHFVPANNLMPLDKIGEMAQAQIDKTKAPPPVQAPARDPGETEDAFTKRIEAWKTGFMGMVEVALRDRDAKTAAMFRDEVSEMLDAAVQKQIDAIPKIDLTPVVEAVESVRESVAEIKPPTVEEITEGMKPVVNQGLADSAEQHAQHVLELEQARDTSESERLALREAELKAREAEIAARRMSERTAVQNMLAVSLRREIDQLMDWEWKWLQKAIDKPMEWVPARAAFYGRFTKQFIANLGEYEPAAEACGIVLDLKWGADRYTEASVRDLKSLDTAAADNYHDRLKETVNIYRNSQWTERSVQLAQDIVLRGVTLFNDRRESNATGN